jgi:protein phosphatase PTC7
MSPTKKCLLVGVVWTGALVTLSAAFQEPLNGLHRRPGTLGRPKTSSTTLFEVPEPLAEEDTWQAYLDEETTGLIYYFDTATGESRWEPPTSTFPTVRLPRRKQRLADSLRKEYRKGRLEMMEGDDEEEDSSEGGVGGLFSAVTSVLEQEVVEVEEIVEEEEVEIEEENEEQPKGGWFGMFNNGGADKGTISEPATVEEPAVEETKDAGKNVFGSFFGVGSASVEVEDKGAVEEPPAEAESKGGVFATPFFKPNTARADKIVQEKIIDDTAKIIKIDIGSHISPHPAKVKWGGEDATFVKGRTFGVFDGVSGAEKLDGVPLYSRTLANEMKKMCGTGGETVHDMTAYLSSAASYADGAATGASTAVVASIGENGFLQALNVGDSCCMVVRDGKVTAKTREISHYWECPYQLSEDSPDQPKDGTKLNVELISGDVIIMGSDGIFDNVDDDQLLELVAQNSGLKPTSLAKKICDVSRKVSLDKTAVTPYSKQAKRRGDPDYRDGLGGKVDDVSCIIVVCK